MATPWDDTVDAHRRDVRQTILDEAAALVTEHGTASVTMTQVAAAAGIGRATLYRYFPGVDEILAAWHRERIAEHLTQLEQVAAAEADPVARVSSVLEELARVLASRPQHDGRHGADLGSKLHAGPEIAVAEGALRGFLAGVLGAAVDAGHLRDDLPPAELAAYCRQAMTAADVVTPQHLVRVVLDGLRARPA